MPIIAAVVIDNQIKTSTMRIYKENTSDNGYIRKCYARDNFAEYHLTSAYAHDLYKEYLQRYNREPSARWYNRHFYFIRIK